MKKKNIRVISFLLMIMLVIGVTMPTTVYATTAETPEDYIPYSDTTVDQEIEYGKEPKDPSDLQKELDELTYEITSLRGENIKHFRLPDGTYQAVIYGGPVHRLNESGVWEDIDNTLTETSGAIVTGDARLKFAKKITGNGNLYTLHNRNYKVTVGLAGAQKKVEGSIVNYSDPEEGTSKLQKLANIRKISSSITYSDILDGIDLEYVIISNSIKENIIVKERSANYSYTFTLALNGLIAKLENGNILLCDSSTDEVIYCIPAPYMYDAAGDESFDVQYSLTATDNGKYEFTLCADESWINSTERSFPVVIDPSLVNIGQTEDTYVTPSAPNTNYGGNHSMFLSNGEVYYKFATPNLPSGTNITSAYVKFPYYYDVTKDIYATVNLYQITSYWNEKSVTWNTRPSINSTCLDTGDIHTDGATVSTPKYKSFSVTSYIRSWYTGTTNYGFALKRVGGTANSVKFVAKEKMQIFAQLTINYTGTNLSEGVYAIRRSGVNYYWRDYQPDSLGWILQDTTSHTAPPLTTSNLENLFKISYRPNYNDYVIRSMIDNSVVVYPSIYNNAPVAGYRSESDSQLSTSYTWKIEYTGGYYYLTYTQSGTKYYVRSKDDNNASKLIFTTNSSDSGTKWSFHVYTGNVYENIQPKDFSYQLTVGDTYQYVAYMRSTRIGHNGPVKYSVKATDLSTTDVATINSTTGMLTAQKVGTFKIGVTYPGAPWLWYWTVNIEKSMEGTYFIQNRHYGKYIQVDDNDAPNYSNNGGVMEQWSFDGENYQRWKFTYVGNGYYKITSVISGYAITVPSGDETNDNVDLVLKPYRESNNQKWKFVLTSHESYKIKAKSSEDYTSKDLVMRVNVQGLHSADGLNIQQRAYSDDTDYKDEWIFELEDTFKITLCGISNSGHDHSSCLKSVRTNLQDADFNNIELITGTVTSTDCLDCLKKSNVFTSRSHGHLIRGSANGPAVSTGIILNDEKDTKMVALYSHSWNGMTFRSKSIASTDSFAGVNLVLFIGCETAHDGVSGKNLPSVVVNQGAEVAIGFSESIDCVEANKWTIDFYSYLLDGHTVQSSVDYASSKRSVDSGLRSAVVCGNGNYKISK